MIAAELIKKENFSLTLQTKLSKSADFFDASGLTHLVVVTAQNNVLGLISKTSIELGLEDGFKTLEDLKSEIKPCPLLTSDCHFFEIIKIFKTCACKVLPVVNAENQCVGVTDFEEIISFESNLYASDKSGSILVIEIEPQNLLLSQLIRVIESNDAKVLGLAISEVIETQKIRIHLKLNTAVLRSVLAGLEKNNFFVYAYFLRQDVNSEEDFLRYKQLLSYLDNE
jgi:acetoin utilization protein AcuB